MKTASLASILLCATSISAWRHPSQTSVSLTDESVMELLGENKDDSLWEQLELADEFMTSTSPMTGDSTHGRQVMEHGFPGHEFSGLEMEEDDQQPLTKTAKLVVSQAEKQFAFMDTNKDHSLTVNEIWHLQQEHQFKNARMAGRQGDLPSNATVVRMTYKAVADNDVSGDGKLSEKEFTAYVLRESEAAYVAMYGKNKANTLMHGP